MNWHEVNFDGLIGPTHNYAGLSFGNVASSSNRRSISTPRAAALQGLDKMEAAMELGIHQAVLPPQPRPDFAMLRRLGFRGGAKQVIEAAGHASPVLLAACYSASSMWTANAATVSPSIDCDDERLHLTPANLISTLHRSIEATQTQRVLEYLFADEKYFCVHDSLPASATLSDEGAANHTRLYDDENRPGIELFVYGRDALREEARAPSIYPARQTLQASEAVARNHLIKEDNCVFIQQNPDAIDAGAFHNDVVSVGHRNAFLYHESAFIDPVASVQQIADRFDGELHCICITESMMPLEEAVRTYLFNSQILSRPDGGMFLLCPDNCVQSESARECLNAIVSGDNPIELFVSLNLKQSMMNGGGPACLRLRVMMNEQQIQSVHQGVMLNAPLLGELRKWIGKHYREQLAPDDLLDPRLATESENALADLEQILDLPRGLLAA